MLKKLLLFFMGLFIIQFGVALFLELNLGSDPFTIFTQGMAGLLGTTPGAANRLLTAVIFLIIFMLDRKNIHIGTFLSILCVGVVLDWMLLIVAPFQLSTYPLVIKIILFIIACIIIGIGVPILKCATLGVPPNDLIYFTVVDFLSKPYGKVRMVTDILFAIVGIMLGGVIGIGTLLCIFLLGPIVEFFFPRIERFTETFLAEDAMEAV